MTLPDREIDLHTHFYFYMGRCALHALLKVIGVNSGDEVILQVFTCAAVPSAIYHSNATPVYADIDPVSFNIDSRIIEKLINGKTKVIVVQHTYGIPADIERIKSIAEKHNIYVIEDCCHTIRSTYGGRELGTFGDASFYSFGWNKPITLGLGGLAVINNPSLLKKMNELYRQLITPSWKEWLFLSVQRMFYNEFLNPGNFNQFRRIYRNQKLRHLLAIIHGYSTEEVFKEGTRLAKKKSGISIYDKRIIPFQKSKLHRELSNIPKLLEHQEWVVSQYRDLLSEKYLRAVPRENNCQIHYYKYPVLSTYKHDIVAKAAEMNVEISDMFRSPLSERDYSVMKSLRYMKGMCPVAENLSNMIIPLSTHRKIQKGEILKTVNVVNSFRP